MYRTIGFRVATLRIPVISCLLNSGEETNSLTLATQTMEKPDMIPSIEKASLVRFDFYLSFQQNRIACIPFSLLIIPGSLLYTVLESPI